MSSTLLLACTDSGGYSTKSESLSSGSISSGSNGAVDNFNYTMLLTNVADNIVLKNYEGFRLESHAYSDEQSTLAEYCSAIGTEDEGSMRAEAQRDWLALMAIWQRAELHHIGPAVREASYRSRIHSYGRTSGLGTCLVDRNVIRAQSPEFDLSKWTYPSRGLEVVEYLLYDDGLAFSCPDESDEKAAWEALNENQKKQSRCHYMRLVMDDVSDAGAQLQQKWLEDGGNYRAEFLETDNIESHIQALSDAMFYIEKFTKDIKLGITAGLKQEGSGDDFCDKTACPERVESPYSRSSLENIRNNLVSFWDLYTGADGQGFDDLISSKGLASVNQAFETDVNEALSFIDTMLNNNNTIIQQSDAILTTNSQAQCANDQANPSLEATYSLCALHAKVKSIADRLRTDFITAVNVSLPQSAQSDAD